LAATPKLLRTLSAIAFDTPIFAFENIIPIASPGAQDRLCHPSPFLPFVVEAMMRHHDSKAQQTGERGQQGRPDGLDMNQIRTALGRDEQSQGCMQHIASLPRTARNKL